MTFEGILGALLISLIVALLLAAGYFTGYNLGYHRGASNYEKHLPEEERHDHYVGY